MLGPRINITLLDKEEQDLKVKKKVTQSNIMIKDEKKDSGLHTEEMDSIDLSSSAKSSIKVDFDYKN